MSDDAALLAAILAHPDEDTPRLMYADWLDEHGQPDRAEFIRIQCDPTADEAAEDRAAELEERNRAKWLAGLPRFVGARWEFRRGFPERLEVEASLLLQRYKAFARVPWLRSLWLRDTRHGSVRHLCGRAWPEQWNELELSFQNDTFLTQYNSSASVADIANCRQTSFLRLLHLSLRTLTRAGVTALAASPHLRGLHRLQLDCEFGNDAGELLAPLRERFGNRLVIG